MRRALVIVLFLAVVATVLGRTAPTAAQDAGLDAAILLAERRIKRQPHSAAAYLRLGDAYIQKARASGDVSYLTRAEHAVRRSVELAPDSAGPWRHLAYIASMRHDFEEAAASAAKAIALDPGDASAHGVLGDAFLEVGRYEQAAAAYERMIALEGSLAAYGRRSGLRNLRGDVSGAIEDLVLAIKVGRASGDPPESIAWAQWQLGAEHFGVGDLAAAEAAYEAALTTFPNYHRGLAGLAGVRAAQGRFTEAIELYRRALAVVPLPELAAALGDVYRRLGRHGEATRQYELVEYIGALNTLNKVIYNRELALFYADHDRRLSDALVLARKEIEARRDIYAFDLLAWVLYKNGQLAEARAAIIQALKLGTRDARLFFHAGMIHHRLGETATARDFLRRALSLNPNFHVLHAETAARTLRAIEDGTAGALR